MAFVTPARLPGVETLRGTLRGVAGSWVRVTRTPAGLVGMFSDGRDIYVIEPAAGIADSAVTALEAAGVAPVIYRLADTVIPVGSTSCGTVTLADIARGGSTAQAQFDAVAGELQVAAATVPTTKQIEVAVVGDFEFSGIAFSGGLTPEQAIAARMNVVDGIFSSQVGVKIIVASVTVFRSAADPFTDTLLDTIEIQPARGAFHHVQLRKNQLEPAKMELPSRRLLRVQVHVQLRHVRHQLSAKLRRVVELQVTDMKRARPQLSGQLSNLRPQPRFLLDAPRREGFQHQIPREHHRDRQGENQPQRHENPTHKTILHHQQRTFTTRCLRDGLPDTRPDPPR